MEEVVVMILFYEVTSRPWKFVEKTFEIEGFFSLKIEGFFSIDLSGNPGKELKNLLIFFTGVLVEAMRKGYWIILDELNLAPSDVLEALNRVLDDNRELFVTETQETIKAHPNFMLFGTQNPPGRYGGRKVSTCSTTAARVKYPLRIQGSLIRREATYSRGVR